MSERERIVARRALAPLGVAWVGQLALLVLLQASLIPSLAFPANHSIAREAYEACFMLTFCAVFFLTSHTLIVVRRSARGGRNANAAHRLGNSAAVRDDAVAAAA